MRGAKAESIVFTGSRALGEGESLVRDKGCALGSKRDNECDDGQAREESSAVERKALGAVWDWNGSDV